MTCKQAWTNRAGVEYAWFNNVEPAPGRGIRGLQDQERWQGRWVLNAGEFQLRSGSRFSRLTKIFSNPVLPEMSDYYEPWTYEYDTLISAPLGEHTPVARPKSLISGKPMQIRWSANWDDDLGGGRWPPRTPSWSRSETRSANGSRWSSSRPSCSTCRASANTA